MPRRIMNKPKPKGSFPSIHDELVLVKAKKGMKQARKQQQTAKYFFWKTMNMTLRLANAKVGRSGHTIKSFEQCISRDSTIREEEMFLMDCIDGTFEV
jgi:hypothetical protein